MVSLKHLVREAHKESAHPKIVTGPHTRWLELPEAEQHYSKEAIEHVIRVLTKKHQTKRSGRFSPSALGECHRKVLFSYGDWPQAGYDPDVLDLMGLGNWGHLRWQAEGLTDGWMVQAEIYVADRLFPMGGTMDGVLVDGSVFELKTVNNFIFKQQVDVDDEPKHSHLLQVHAYMRMAKKRLASILYEERSSGQYHEFRVEWDDAIMDELVDLIDLLTGYVEIDELPEMLDECKNLTGRTFKGCPFRKICPKATTVRMPG